MKNSGKIIKCLSLIVVALVTMLCGCAVEFEIPSDNLNGNTTYSFEYDYSSDWDEATSEEINSEGLTEEQNELLVEEGPVLTFRNEDLLNDHFEKHGIDMGFATAEDYELAAAKVVFNPDSLHKTEKEDGDDVYYLESTNEFVIVSTDGYLRTYFLPDKGIAYYEKQ